MIVKILTDTAYAASTPTTLDKLLKAGDKTVVGGQESGILLLVQSLMDRIPYILGGLAVLALLYSGFLYIMALGDPTKMESAKKNITWVFTGILAVALIVIIMNIVIKITGLTTNFTGSGSSTPF